MYTRILHSVLFLLGLLFLGGCSAKGEPDSSRQLNKVILISIDTLRADFLGCYNSTMKTTPNLDRFAQENVFCANVTSQAPSTAISHKSIFYSLYPGIHKMTKTSIPEETLKAPLEVLQSKGFKTAGFVGGGQLNRKFGFAKGFDNYWEAATKDREEPDHKKNLTDTETQVVRWLEENQDQKFFLFVHTYEVHCPYTPPRPYRERFAGWYQGDVDPRGKCGDNYYNQRTMSSNDIRFIRDLYAAQVNYVDAFLGRLFGKLKALGIYDQTLIIFLSDHGESLGERGYVGHNQLYDVQLRIPLILHIPGAGGVRIDSPLEAIDVMPTIFDWVQLQSPYHFQGKSLLPLLVNPSGNPADRILISEQNQRVRVRRGNMVSIFSRDGIESPEVYNLTTDPQEHNNLAFEDTPLLQADKRDYLKMLNENRKLSAGFVVTGSSRPQLDAETAEQLKALGYVDGIQK